MRKFLDWVDADTAEPAIIKAGLAHLWFVTVHPLEDGNGRVARALGDLRLARADHSSRRFYSLSAQIQRDRAAYYRILERTQKGSLDVTEWLIWFLEALRRAIVHSDETVDKVLLKSRFWRHRQSLPMNDRQITKLNRSWTGSMANSPPQVGHHHQMLSGHRPARYQRTGRTRSVAAVGRGRSEYLL